MSADENQAVPVPLEAIIPSSGPLETKRKEDEERSSISSSRSSSCKKSKSKSRFIWTAELDRVFVDACNAYIKDVVPTRIFKQMRSRGVSDVSREDVVSHLQKYPLHLEKKLETDSSDDDQLLDEETSSCLSSSSAMGFQNHPPTTPNWPNMTHSYSLTNNNNVLQPEPSLSSNIGGAPMMGYYSADLSYNDYYCEKKVDLPAAAAAADETTMGSSSSSSNHIQH